MSTVLVTGAGGLLGLCIGPAFRRAGFQVVALRRAELDVTDPAACRAALEEAAPVAVVDCSEPYARVAPTGVGALARAAAAVGALSVLMSCAEVFDGAQEDPYVESDAPAPRTARGEARLDAERAVARGNPRHAIVRSSWLYGVGGRTFAGEILAGSATGGTVEVDALARGTPSYSGHVAEALVPLVARPAHGIFHVEGTACSRLQFARALLSGSGGGRAVAATSDLGERTATQHVLISRRDRPLRIPDWRLGLSAYLEEHARALWKR